MPNINIDRIEQDILTISRFGLQEGARGIYRQGFGKADMEARKWLGREFEKMGMSHHMDGAGNVIGRFGLSDKPAIAIGSHLDSVPAAGRPAGALAGLYLELAVPNKSIALYEPPRQDYQRPRDRRAVVTQQGMYYYKARMYSPRLAVLCRSIPSAMAAG